MQFNKTVMIVTITIAAITIGSSYAAEIDLSNINLSDFQNQLPSDLPKTNLTLDDFKTLLEDKCIQVAGTDNGTRAFKEIESSTTTLAECINGIINYTAIQEEITEASPKGELDVVFNKYCLKRPQALVCVETFSSKMSPCFDNDELENQDVFMRIVKSLLDFICHKGGDQIALFIAEKGPECLESHKENIQNCINSTFSGYVPAEKTLKTLPKFVIGVEQCDDIDRLETCIVEKLESCPEITPANIVESMFRFVKNEISAVCRNRGSRANKQIANSANNIKTTGVMLFLTLMLVFRK